MDYDSAKKYIEKHLFEEFLPHIDFYAKDLMRNNPHKFDSQDSGAHQELYHAGLMGLISAIKNWNPSIASAKGNSFITHARNSIKGHMYDHVHGQHSHERESTLHPTVQKEFNLAEKKRRAAEQPSQESSDQPQMPSLPKPQNR